MLTPKMLDVRCLMLEARFPALTSSIQHLRSYQLDLTTPGICPSSANWRKQIRHKLNFRRYPRARPQRLQREYARTPNFGFRSAFAINDFFAIALQMSEVRYQISEVEPGLNPDI